MKILVFIDPSFRGEWAVSLAQDLAQGLRASVLLLTTTEYLAKDPTLLDHAAEKFKGAKNLEIEKKARPGPPREAIIAEQYESHPAISVFPPAGRKGIARMFKGSRVKAVVHKAAATVMVARKPVSEHIHRILVTVSGGPMSHTTVLSAQEIANSLGAELTILHVASGVSIPYGEEATEEAGSRGISRLNELIAKAGMKQQVRVREGMVIHEILAECHDGGYDLLILGQHLADRETDESLTENLAELLAMESPIPVLVVRPGKWAADVAAGVESKGR